MPIVKKYMRIASVRKLSMVSTSLENRFVMRPSGVVSKKAIGARSVLVIARFSITLLDVVPNTVRDTEKPNIRSACETPSAAYAPMYVPDEKPNLSLVHQESQREVTMLAGPWVSGCRHVEVGQ
jgi:hypothetical protein